MQRTTPRRRPGALGPGAFRVVQAHIRRILPLVERPPSGRVPFPYLVCTHGVSYGGNAFVWDHHHTAMRLAVAGRPEYLRHLADNLLHFQEGSGFMPNCFHPDVGPRNSYTRYHAQPFVMQGVYLYLRATGDRNWVAARFDRLLRYLQYYEEKHRAPNGLHRWAVSWMSGFDNEVVSFLPAEALVPASLSSWLALEYRAASAIAARLGRARDAAACRRRASAIAAAVNRLLWSDEHASYAALNLYTGKPLFRLDEVALAEGVGAYSFQTCSNLIPLYAGIAPPDRARAMIRRYVLDERHFMSPYGIRSLSRSSEYYNTAVWGNPPYFNTAVRLTNSNWQGPVWIPLSYFMASALRRYGFRREAADLAARTIRLLARSVREHGCFFENYDGDTGAALYAREFASWNVLADVMPDEARRDTSPMDDLFAR